MTDPIALTKSQVAAGLQCRKRLHLEVRGGAPAEPADAGRQALREQGVRVGELARARFPGGVLVAERHPSWAAAVRATAALLGDPGTPAIYEGAFVHEGVRVRPDVLWRVDDGFELIEVKAATRVRERHELEAALQLQVLEASGVPVRRAGVMLLDRDYVYAGGTHDLQRLFAVHDLTKQARALGPWLVRELAALHAVVRHDAPPAVPTGLQCRVPYRCPFFAHCHEGEPAHPVSELPSVIPEQLADLAARGIRDLRDVPDDVPGLTPLQRRVRDVVRRGEPFRDPAVDTALAAVRLPAHFIDFETIATAIPVFPGTRPFEQVPFQWSDHVLAASGALTHREFLHDDPSDPRRAFAVSLLAATRDAAAVVVYSRFESDVLDALAGELPDLAAELQALRARLVDLLPIVRAHYYHPALHGSFSIKAVLPAMVPGLGYDDLDIRDGLTASLAHARLRAAGISDERRAELRAQLLAYCRRDTLAMVELVRALRQ